MSTSLRKILPWVILGAGIAALLLLPLSARVRSRYLVDTGRTRPVVDLVFAKLQALKPKSLDDGQMRGFLEKVVGHMSINSLWLFTPDGRIVYQAGSKADPARFYNWATSDMREIIYSLPTDTLSREQKGALIAVAALRGIGGGDHNDVWRQDVTALRSPDGKLVGWLGAVYDVSPGISANPSVGSKLIILLALLSLMLYKASMVAWVYLDARARGERAWVWAMFTLIGDLMALIAYLLVRTPRPRTTTNA